MESDVWQSDTGRKPGGGDTIHAPSQGADPVRWGYNKYDALVCQKGDVMYRRDISGKRLIHPELQAQLEELLSAVNRDAGRVGLPPLPRPRFIEDLQKILDPRKVFASAGRR